MQNTVHTINTNGMITTEFHGTIRGLLFNNNSKILMIIEFYDEKILVHIAQKIEILTAMSTEEEDLSDLYKNQLGSDYIKDLSGKRITIIIDHFPYEEKEGNKLIVLGEHAHAQPRQILLSDSKKDNGTFFL